MVLVGRSPRLRGPAGGELLTIQRQRGLTSVSCNGACGPLTKTEGGELLTIQQKEDLRRCPAMAPVGHSPRLKAPIELLTIQQLSATKTY